MAGLNAAFPNAPLVDAAGNVAQVWRSFLLALFGRTGGGVGISGTDTAAAVSAETGARTAADTSLSDAVVAEAALRAATDTAEAAARVAADAALSARIGSLATTSATAPLLARIWFTQ